MNERSREIARETVAEQGERVVDSVSRGEAGVASEAPFVTLDAVVEPQSEATQLCVGEEVVSAITGLRARVQLPPWMFDEEPDELGGVDVAVCRIELDTSGQPVAIGVTNQAIVDALQARGIQGLSHPGLRKLVPYAVHPFTFDGTYALNIIHMTDEGIVQLGEDPPSSDSGADIYDLPPH